VTDNARHINTPPRISDLPTALAAAFLYRGTTF
jgi:hypothetical protein